MTVGHSVNLQRLHHGFCRRHGPRGYADYSGYKPWLRDDFWFTCIYCLARESWYPSGHGSFSVDHITPRSRMGADDYDNLVYACCACNSARRATGVLDPTSHRLIDHLELQQDGRFSATTIEGSVLIDVLLLNEQGRVEARQAMMDIISLYFEIPDNPRVKSVFQKYFSLPKDAPDLRKLRPPGGNLEPSSAEDCLFARVASHKMLPVY